MRLQNPTALCTSVQSDVRESNLVEDFQNGGMHGVAAKITVEILVHFEKSHGNTLARQEKSKYGAGGSSTDDTTRSGLYITNLVLSERSLIHIVCSLILSEFVLRLVDPRFT